jgi:hypothetical protein
LSVGWPLRDRGSRCVTPATRSLLDRRRPTPIVSVCTASYTWRGRAVDVVDLEPSQQRSRVDVLDRRQRDDSAHEPRD